MPTKIPRLRLVIQNSTTKKYLSTLRDGAPSVLRWLRIDREVAQFTVDQIGSDWRVVEIDINKTLGIGLVGRPDR